MGLRGNGWGFFDAVEKLFCFDPPLWEVSSACGRTRYFPRAGKYPKGTGGGQRVHAAWPPPVPPLLRNNAPLASQGRAQLGSLPSLGGPLSPSAQLIPPPAPGRRFIPGVVARDRHGRDTLRRYVPRLRYHTKCVPDTNPVGRETGGRSESPLAGGAILQRKKHFAQPGNQFSLALQRSSLLQATGKQIL